MSRVVVVLLLLFGPFCAGLWGGIETQRLSSPRLRKGAAAALVLLALVPFAFAALRSGATPVGLWDLVLLSAAYYFGLSLSLACTQPRFGAKLLLGLTSSTLAIGAAELGVRLLLPAFDRLKLPDPSSQTLLLPTPEGGSVPYVASNLGWNQRACSTLFAHRLPSEALRAEVAAIDSKASHVLHVGDSMVQTRGETQQRFTDLLADRMPEHAHVNLGNSDTGPDAYLAAVRAWRDLVRVDLVVVYFFPGNDVTDIDRPYVCCGQSALLRYERDYAAARCDAPQWPSPGKLWLLNSPPPFPLRAATAVSESARYATYLLYSKPASNFPPQASLEPEHWRRIDLVFKTLRDELRQAQIPLVAVLLPYRAALEAQHPVETTVFTQVAARFLALASRLQISTLNAWELFQEALQKTPSRDWFLTSQSSPTNSHFSDQGHRLVADWLRPRIVWPPGIPAATRPPETVQATTTEQPTCVFLPGAESGVVDAYLRAWSSKNGLAEVTSWNLSCDRAQAAVGLNTPSGPLTLSWSLLADCRAGTVATDSARYRGVIPSAQALQQFASDFPAPHSQPRQSPRSPLSQSSSIPWPWVAALALALLCGGAFSAIRRVPTRS